jgi:hypothetical protein
VAPSNFKMKQLTVMPVTLEFRNLNFELLNELTLISLHSNIPPRNVKKD